MLTVGPVKARFRRLRRAASTGGAATLALALAAGCGARPEDETRSADDARPDAGERSPPESDATGDEKALLLLENERCLVGILPRVGGRVVLFRRRGGENVLLADPALWDEPEEKRPVPSPDAGFVPYDGMIVWAGPQAEWWAHQTVNPRRSGDWPPDPWLIYGDFEITRRTPTRATMTGPASPVSGLKLTKDIVLEGDRVRFRFTATNARDEAVAWDLWPNARFPGHQPCYVPVASEGSVRTGFGHGDAGELGDLPHEVVDGFFSFRVRGGVPEGKRELRMEAFIDPAEGAMATFAGPECFIQRSPRVPPEEVAPDHAFAEVWNSLHRDPAKSILELEFHGAYRKLAPGESMEMEMTWELHRYAGEGTAAGHVAFLKGILARGVGR
ncbi:MAG: DUF4380 domain-containing protein [Planctomycetota bacterium]|jgi:hypothetical protein